MVRLIHGGVYLINGREILTADAYRQKIRSQPHIQVTEQEAAHNTISSQIIRSHNVGSGENLELKFDMLTSHDMTNVGIIQTARACGLKKFPLPVVLTNCQNTLCAIGGTINRDDHVFAYTAAQKYGGICIPVNISVIHTYMREMMASCGAMIMGADSHTRYGALGTMGVGEGGGELVKQMMNRTYSLKAPKVIAVYLSGKVNPGIGPHDVALAIIGTAYKNNFVKNAILEFVGDGVENLSMDYRNGIDVMTTETACWTSIWKTDQKVRDYMIIHGREEDYKELKPGKAAYYDGMVYVDLSQIKSMIALPFHPSNVYAIEELNQNAQDILHKVELDALELTGNSNLRLNLSNKYYDGAIHVDQGIVGGCSGGCFENINAVADTVRGGSVGNSVFSLTVYPDSQPTYLELVKNGSIGTLMQSGVICREAICGPCTGAGEIPGNGELSIRHNTRNFIYREGAKPGDGQHAWVALMDARSIAVTAMNGGRLISAENHDIAYSNPEYHFEKSIYNKRIYNGVGNPKPETELIEGPNIKPWPEIPALKEHLLVKVCSYITDPVTTTDELIPSGDTSSYRSNPIQMSEFTLCRRAPDYVSAAKQVYEIAEKGETGENIWREPKMSAVLKGIRALPEGKHLDEREIGLGSTIYAKKPGDGSAREQAASCQRVLGGAANLVEEYATKRYRSNLINWGIIPFETRDMEKFHNGDYIFFPYVKSAVSGKQSSMIGYVLGNPIQKITVTVGELSDEERKILIDGCMINYYRN